MKSRTRKNRSHILVAFGKSITSALALDLVMLFCHAGADVKTAILPGAEDYVAIAPLKQLTQQSVYSEICQPPWALAAKKFDLSIVIAPCKTQQNALINGQSDNFLLDTIKKRSRQLIIANEKELVNLTNQAPPELVSFFELSANPHAVARELQQLFAIAIEKLARAGQTEKLRGLLTFSAPEQAADGFSPPPWFVHLKETIIHNGIQLVDNVSAPHDFCIEAFGEPETIEPLAHNQHHEPCQTAEPRLHLRFLRHDLISDLKPATSQQVFLAMVGNGIQLIDQHGSRLLPSISGYSPCNRLVKYIIDRLAASAPEQV